MASPIRISPAMRFAVFAAIALSLALTIDYYGWPAYKLRVEVFWVVGFLLLLGFFSWRAVYPALSWLSPTLFRSAARPLPMRVLEWERCGRLPWVVIAAGGLNVGQYAVETANTTFIVTRPQYVQKLGKHTILNARDWPVGHDFSEWPEIHEALKRIGWKDSATQEIRFAPFTTLSQDREYKALDLRGLAQRVIGMADETRQLAREARQKVLAQIDLLKQVRRR